MRVLVSGATGFVGRSLIPPLVAVAGTRRPSSYTGPGEAVELDLARPPTVDAALDACDAAYYLVHGLTDSGDFAAQEARAARTFAAAAARRGARVVYLGGLGEQSAQLDRSAHLRSRHQVGRILRSAVDTVELQAAVVLGAGSVMFEALRRVVCHLPVLVAPDWVDTRTQPIGVGDAVRYLEASLTLPAGRYQIGGADTLTYGDMIERFSRLVGRHTHLLRVPVVAPDLAARALGVATEATILARAIPATGLLWSGAEALTGQSLPVALRLIEGLSVEAIVTEPRIRELVPFEPAGYEEACRQALAA
jgi:uncharacterized protein YbjT (DUF2867 family)